MIDNSISVYFIDATPMLDGLVMVRQCLWIAVVVSITTLSNMSYFTLWALTMNRPALTVTTTSVSSGKILLTV